MEAESTYCAIADHTGSLAEPRPLSAADELAAIRELLRMREQLRNELADVQAALDLRLERLREAEQAL